MEERREKEKEKENQEEKERRFSMDIAVIVEFKDTPNTGVQNWERDSEAIATIVD